MNTDETKNSPQFAHLLRASPEALAEMQRIVHESVRADRERAAKAEAARVIAQIVQANNRRLGLASPPAPTTALGKAIVRADERRRGG